MDTTRFDAFAKLLAAGGTRRRLVAGVGLLGLAGALARPATRVAAANTGCKAVLCPQGYWKVCYYDLSGEICKGCVCEKVTTTGIAGGGLVTIDGGGEAHLALLATRGPDPADASALLVIGQFQWTDLGWEGVGLQMQGTQVTAYGPTEGVDGGRDVAGWLDVSAATVPVPFFLQVVAADSAGTERDTISLLVGDAVPAELVPDATAVPSGFTYEANGVLAGGDFALVNFGMGGDQVPGTPTA